MAQSSCRVNDVAPSRHIVKVRLKAIVCDLYLKERRNSVGTGSKGVSKSLRMVTTLGLRDCPQNGLI